MNNAWGVPPEFAEVLLTTDPNAPGAAAEAARVRALATQNRTTAGNLLNKMTKAKGLPPSKYQELTKKLE
jgi:hypothetical protein